MKRQVLYKNYAHKKTLKTLVLFMIIVLGILLSGCKPETENSSITYTISEGGSISGDLHQTVERAKMAQE